MKKLLSLLISILGCWSCSSGNDEPAPAPVPEETPNIEFDSSSQTTPVLPQTGGTASVSFTTNKAWTVNVSEIATRATTWITVSPTSGNAGNHTLTITTTENDTYDERNATVTLKAGSASKAFSIKQKQKDALTVTSNKIELTAIGGQATVEVKANVQYQYEIEQAAQSWITRATATRGLSASTLVFNIAENEGLEKREGKITVRSGELSETVTVYQEGSKPTLVLTQNEYTVGSDGETIKVELKSNINYEVKLPADGWITETTTRAFSSHTHHFNVAANTDYDERTAEIVFINKDNGIEEKVKVTQVQKNAIIIAQSEYTVPAIDSTLDFDVNANVDFTVTISEEWIKQITTKGLTTKSLHFTIAENTSDKVREGEIVISYKEQKQTIKVIQNGKSVFYIKQKEYDVTAGGETIQVEVTATGEYSVKLPDVDWITETKAASGLIHTFVITPNQTYDERSAEILFIDKESGNVEKVKVTQKQLDVINIEQKEYTVPAIGGTLDFDVNTNVDFTVTTSEEWIKQITTKGLTTKSLHFTIAENTSDKVREGEIVISYKEQKQTIKVIQNGKAVFYIKQKEYDVTAGGETIQVEVTATGEYSVKLPDVDWITETKAASGLIHTFVIAPNKTYDERSAEILFTDKESGIEEKVKVTQKQLDVINIEQNQYDFPAEGGTLDIQIKANIDFTVTPSHSWIQQVTTRSMTTKALRFTITENSSENMRVGNIVLKGNNITQTITIKQSGADNTTEGGIDDMPIEPW